MTSQSIVHGRAFLAVRTCASFLPGAAGIGCYSTDREPNGTDYFTAPGQRTSCREGNEFCRITIANVYPDDLELSRRCGSIGNGSNLKSDLYAAQQRWVLLQDSGLDHDMICVENPSFSMFYQDQRKENFVRTCLGKSKYCNNHTFEQAMRAPTVLKNPEDQSINQTMYLEPSRNTSLEYHRNLWTRLDDELFRNKNRPTLEQQRARMGKEGDRLIASDHLDDNTFARLDLPPSNAELTNATPERTEVDLTSSLRTIFAASFLVVFKWLFV